MKLYNIFNFRNPSITLIFLPYLFYNLGRVLDSPYYSSKSLLLICLTIIISDLLLRQISLKFNNRLLLSKLIVWLILLNFYGFYTVDFIHELFKQFFNFDIRGRLIFFIIFLLSSIFLIIKIISYKGLNIFLIITSLLIVSSRSHHKLIERKFDSNYIQLNPKQKKSFKPILLIISDEYCSPDELYKFKRDSSIYKFSNLLKENNWIVKNNFFSFETQTSRSLKSMFNFNLSHDSSFQKLEKIYKYSKDFNKSKLSDSLIKKNINIINLGIFSIGEERPFVKLSLLQNNFSEELFMFTTFNAVKFNTQNFSPNGFRPNFQITQNLNKFLIENLGDTLRRIKNKKFFSYAHLYMPHQPYKYFNDINENKSKIENYYKFWCFTNLKLKIIINSLKDDYRIILTGDHGYRGNNKINPHNTFTAFYGFENNLIDSLNSVQDLGSLINSYY
jgi:hypothetical protein